MKTRELLKVLRVAIACAFGYLAVDIASQYYYAGVKYQSETLFLREEAQRAWVEKMNSNELRQLIPPGRM